MSVFRSLCMQEGADAGGASQKKTKQKNGGVCACCQEGATKVKVKPF